MATAVIHRVAAALAAVTLMIAAVPSLAETVKVESRVHGKPLNIPVQILLPEKRADGKIPAMIIMHGSGGVRGRERSYAREFNALGVAAVIIDSFSPRGVRSTVRDQSPVSSYDMVVDAISTLKAVGQNPAIDASRIGMIGFSKGGTVVVKSALRSFVEPLAAGEARFALLIAMYPWCGDLPLDFHAASDAPLHMLLGERDTYAGTEACKEFGKRYADAGGKLTLKVFAGAQHDWDVPGSAHWSDGAGQNMSKCIFDEVSPGTWVERISKIAVMQDGKRTGNSRKAQDKCMTYGVGGGYSAPAHAQSTQDIRGFVRAAFKLP
jgi:dienelactone hydrolase